MDFESRLRELESLAGSESALNLFNEAYQSLLLEVQRLPKEKAEKLETMRRVLYKQFLYLFAQWRRVKATDPEELEREIKTTRGEMS